MYTIKVNDDNSLVASNKTIIMQKSSNVDIMHFLVAPTYNDYDMTDFTCMLEYILPISRQYKTEVLIPSVAMYQDEFIEYILPINSELTAEAGDVEIQLTFAMSEEDVDGDKIEHIRKTASSKITITPIANWTIDAGVDNKLLEINEKLKKLESIPSV